MLCLGFVLQEQQKMAASLAEENLLVTDDFNRQVSTCFPAVNPSHSFA